MAQLLGQLHAGLVECFYLPNYIYITLLANIIADKTIIRDVFNSNEIIISTFAAVCHASCFPPLLDFVC
jgi:hypothetical protein